MKAISVLGLIGAVLLCGGILAAKAVGWKPLRASWDLSTPTPCPDSSGGGGWKYQWEPDDIPVYPNSQQRETKNYTWDEGVGRELFLPDTMLAVITREISLLSIDSVQEIESFYREALEQANWMLDEEKSEPGELRFFWIPIQPEGPCAPTPVCCQPIYYAHISINRSGSKFTSVEIQEAIMLGK
jgi:hypothetical protein